MNKKEIREIVYQQLADDYSCSLEMIKDHDNHFIIYEPQENRRMYKWEEDLFLKGIVVNGKIIMAGKKEIIEVCQKIFEKHEGEWLMEAKDLILLENTISTYGYTLIHAHPFFIAYDESEIECPFDIKYVDHDQIMLLKDHKEFKTMTNAFTFAKQPRDEVGILAYDQAKLIGVAGASSDAKKMWQIGIDVDPEYRGKHLATILVTLLKNEILKQGAVPFYGTAMSHIHSQNVAINSGFVPFWSELITAKKK